MTIVIATRNEGKLSELTKLLGGDSDIDFKSLNNFSELDELEIEETGQTYQQNAELKARIIAEKLDLPTIADDSGLEVSALDNFPGVKSARWMPGSDDERSRGLLKKLADAKNRSAQFIAVLCLFDPKTKFQSCVRGTLKGVITRSPSGNNGFGYDPIFMPEGYNQTLADLGEKTKNEISHRSQAADKLSQLLLTKYGKLNSSSS